MFLGGRWPDDAGFDMLDVEERTEEVLVLVLPEHRGGHELVHVSHEPNSYELFISFWVAWFSVNGVHEQISLKFESKPTFLFTNFGLLQCSQITNCRNQGFMTPVHEFGFGSRIRSSRPTLPEPRTQYNFNITASGIFLHAARLFSSLQTLRCQNHVICKYPPWYLTYQKLEPIRSLAIILNESIQESISL